MTAHNGRTLQLLPRTGDLYIYESPQRGSRITARSPLRGPKMEPYYAVVHRQTGGAPQDPMISMTLGVKLSV